MSSVVIIEELAGTRRRLTLQGSGLPLQGAEWGVEMTLATTWNAGNPEATQQVLGPREMPSTWNFEWRLLRLISSPARLAGPDGSGQTIDRPHDLALIVEDFQRGGILLRVTWIASVGRDANVHTTRISRLGRISSFSPKYNTGEDLAATLTFEWIGRANDQQKVSEIRGGSLAAAQQKAIRASDRAADAIANNIIRDAVRGIPFSARSFTLGQLESMAEAPRQMADSFARTANSITGRVKQIAGVVEKTRDVPHSLAGSALDVAASAVGAANAFLDSLTRESYESWTTRNKVAVLTRTASYYSGAMTEADLMVGAYLELAEQARKRQSAATNSSDATSARVEDLYRIHVPKSGETFAEISRRYYGTADLGDEIAKINGLPSYSVVAPLGKPLVVPNRSRLDVATRNNV